MNNTVIYKGGTPHKGQQRILKGVLGGKERYNCINASRQSGKSFLLKQLILYFGINEVVDTLVVSPYNSQNTKIFDEVNKAIRNSNIIKKANRSEKIIELINGSTITFKSAENPTAIRGGTYKYVFCDEQAYFKEGVFQTVIAPTTAAKKGARFFIFSTPRGKNEFYDLCVLGQNNDEKSYAYYYMSYKENPNMDVEFVEECRKRYPKAKFAQEFLGEFVDAASVFDYINCALLDEWVEPQEGIKYYVGVDLANKKDRTVVTVMDEDGTVVFIYAITNSSWKKIVEDIVLICKKYNNAEALVEINSPGDVVYELLTDVYYSLTPIYTQNANKQEYIEELIKAFGDGEVFIPTKRLCPELHTELDTFEMSYSPKTRKIVYSARVGFHDDHIISLALANKCKKDNWYPTSQPGQNIDVNNIHFF